MDTQGSLPDWGLTRQGDDGPEGPSLIQGNDQPPQPDTVVLQITDVRELSPEERDRLITALATHQHHTNSVAAIGENTAPGWQKFVDILLDSIESLLAEYEEKQRRGENQQARTTYREMLQNIKVVYQDKEHRKSYEIMVKVQHLDVTLTSDEPLPLPHQIVLDDEYEPRVKLLRVVQDSGKSFGFTVDEDDNSKRYESNLRSLIAQLEQYSQQLRHQSRQNQQLAAKVWRLTVCLAAATVLSLILTALSLYLAYLR